MDALHLGIKHRFRIDRDPGGGFEPGREVSLTVVLRFKNGITESCIFRKWFQSRELAKVSNPFFTDGFANCLRERYVAKAKPTSWGYAIGLVIKTLGKNLRQLFDRRRAKKLRMNCGNAVGAVQTENGEIRHTNLEDRPFLDQAHTCNKILVSRESFPHVIEEAPIDLVDDLEEPGRHDAKPLDRPSFECLGKQCVVGVGGRFLGNVPSLIPTETGFVEQDAP